MIGIIGGSGLYQALEEMKDKHEEVHKTPYGNVPYSRGKLFGVEVIYISRHGTGANIPPHKVPYRANVWALKELKCDCIISTSAVGSLNMKYPIGEIVLPDQFLDFSKEVYTYFEGGEIGLRHVDMTEPFCPALRKHIRKAGESNGISIHMNGTYTCMSGPNFETAAEVKMLQRLGGDLVGMTVVPEAKLARELGICYQTICLPVNYGAGMTREPITHEKTLKMVEQMKSEVLSLFEAVLPTIPKERDCRCAKS